MAYSSLKNFHFHIIHDNVRVVKILVKDGIDINRVYSGKTALMLAASNRSDKEIARVIIKYGANINSRDPIKKQTALHYASSSGSLEICELLVNEKANVDAQDSLGRTPLILAAMAGHENIVQLLVRTGATINCCDPCKNTVLHYAVQRNCGLEVLQLLLNRGAPVDVQNDEGKTPLMFAANLDFIDAVGLLLNAGADVNLRNSKMMTALHYAASYSGMVQLFIDNGCTDLDVKDSDGSTPLMLATNAFSKANVELLVKLGADVHCCDNEGFTALHFAAAKGFVEIVQFLVGQEADIAATTTNGQTPLMLASRCNMKDVVEMLVEAGADVNCRIPCDFNTALHYAAMSRNTDIGQIVQCLVNNGADLECLNGDGCTPLMMAVRFRSEAVMTLVDLGADVDKCFITEWTILHAACEKGWIEVVQLLIDKNVDLEAKIDGGMTPLMLAALFGREAVVELLLKAKVDVNCKDDKWMTALHYSSRRGFRGIIELLLKNKADINARNKFGQTPLHLALERLKVDWSNIDVSMKIGNVITTLLNEGADSNLEDNWKKSSFTLITDYCPVKLIILCIEKGAFFKAIDYDLILEIYRFKKHILQNVQVSTQAYINKVNNSDLPCLYRLVGSEVVLPKIDKLLINYTPGNHTAQLIERAVSIEIQTKGHCNILELHPLALSLTALNSLLKYFNSH